MQNRADLAAIMNRLPFVLWDRFTERDSKGVAYGWIERPDSRSDFVILDYEYLDDGGIAVGYATSSAAHSAEIGILLYGEEEADHHPCLRVDEELGDLVENKVVLA